MVEVTVSVGRVGRVVEIEVKAAVRIAVEDTAVVSDEVVGVEEVTAAVEFYQEQIRNLSGIIGFCTIFILFYVELLEKGEI